VLTSGAARRMANRISPPRFGLLNITSHRVLLLELWCRQMSEPHEPTGAQQRSVQAIAS
jgi:hypothetical protein